MTVNLTLKSVLSSLVLLVLGSVLCAITIPMILLWVPTFQSWLAIGGFSGVQYHIFSTIPYWMVCGQILVTLVLASPISVRQRPLR